MPFPLVGDVFDNVLKAPIRKAERPELRLPAESRFVRVQIKIDETTRAALDCPNNLGNGMFWRDRGGNMYVVGHYPRGVEDQPHSVCGFPDAAANRLLLWFLYSRHT